MTHPPQRLHGKPKESKKEGNKRPTCPRLRMLQLEAMFPPLAPLHPPERRLLSPKLHAPAAEQKHRRGALLLLLLGLQLRLLAGHAGDASSCRGLPSWRRRIPGGSCCVCQPGVVWHAQHDASPGGPLAAAERLASPGAAPASLPNSDVSQRWHAHWHLACGSRPSNCPVCPAHCPGCGCAAAGCGQGVVKRQAGCGSSHCRRRHRFRCCCVVSSSGGSEVACGAEHSSCTRRGLPACLAGLCRPGRQGWCLLRRELGGHACIEQLND